MVGYDDIHGRPPMEPYCAGCERLEQEQDETEAENAHLHKRLLELRDQISHDLDERCTEQEWEKWLKVPEPEKEKE